MKKRPDPPAEVANSGAVRLMIHLNSKEEALKVVETLSEGGTVIAPLSPHPKPDDSGMGAIVKGAHGYPWIFTCPDPDCG